MIIKTDELHGPEIHALLKEHLRNMSLHSPPESVHALDIDALRKPGITFWTAWDNAELLGCGALKLLDAQGADDAPHAEIKSMRTAAAHLRKGVARALLSHIIDVARQRGYARLSLETGSTPAFKPAHQLYKDFAFVECGPFADYLEDPFSIFMTKTLGEVAGIYHYRVVDERLSTSGQPSVQQLRDIAAAGFQTVINLALHDDPRYSLPDEPGVVQSLGMAYVHIPVQFAAPTRADLLAFFAAMDAHQGNKVWVHCAANFRVTAFLGLYRVIRQGWDPAPAFAMMNDVWQPDGDWAAFISAQLAAKP